MRPLTERIRGADSLLERCAVPHAGGLGRMYPEPEDDTRFPFQRDRDRIIHTQAFRRLKHKTQVFVSGHGDHYRTRITHTLEVAQISRDVARTLGLNEDLAEAIALAHDLGHTPFGHAGEEAMQKCMEPFKKRFEHNEQSLRIVTVLENRTTNYPGLNLNQEILEGLMKHRTPHDNPELVAPRSSSLEAQVVNLADEIAYTAHDTDDGLRAEIFSAEDLRKIELGKMASNRARASGAEVRGALVHLLVSDLYTSFDASMKEHRIGTVDDVYRATASLVSFSPDMQRRLDELREFLWQNLYVSPAVQTQAKRGQQIITELFQAYISSPPTKVLTLQQKTGGALEEAVKDYIAGMTDGYAEGLYRAVA